MFSFNHENSQRLCSFLACNIPFPISTNTLISQFKIFFSVEDDPSCLACSGFGEALGYKCQSQDCSNYQKALHHYLAARKLGNILISRFFPIFICNILISRFFFKFQLPRKCITKPLLNPLRPLIVKAL